MRSRRLLHGLRGFSLIELMIVVAIIGILASIVVPNYMKFRCKAKTTEAKAVLGGLKHFEAIYYAEQNTYYCPGGGGGVDIAALADAGFDFSQTQYHILLLVCFPGTPPGYLATMKSKWEGPAGPDTWTMNEDGMMGHTLDGCLF